MFKINVLQHPRSFLINASFQLAASFENVVSSLKVIVETEHQASPSLCDRGNDRLSAVPYGSAHFGFYQVCSQSRCAAESVSFYFFFYYWLLCKRSRFMLLFWIVGLSPVSPSEPKGKCWFCVLNECYQGEPETNTRTIHLPNGAAGMSPSVSKEMFHQGGMRETNAIRLKCCLYILWISAIKKKFGCSWIFKSYSCIHVSNIHMCTNFHLRRYKIPSCDNCQKKKSDTKTSNIIFQIKFIHCN